MGPFCHTPKADHISKLMLMRATRLMGAHVHEVKLDLKEQDPTDFDTTLIVSSVAAAYPELYKSCLEDWSSHSWDRDLVSEVFPLTASAFK